MALSADKIPILQIIHVGGILSGSFLPYKCAKRCIVTAPGFMYDISCNSLELPLHTLMYIIKSISADKAAYLQIVAVSADSLFYLQKYRYICRLSVNADNLQF